MEELKFLELLRFQGSVEDLVFLGLEVFQGLRRLCAIIWNLGSLADWFCWEWESSCKFGDNGEQGFAWE